MIINTYLQIPGLDPPLERHLIPLPERPRQLDYSPVPQCHRSPAPCPASEDRNWKRKRGNRQNSEYLDQTSGIDARMSDIGRWGALRTGKAPSASSSATTLAGLGVGDGTAPKGSWLVFLLVLFFFFFPLAGISLQLMT